MVKFLVSIDFSDFQRTAVSSSKQVSLTLRLKNCDTSWDDVSYLGQSYVLIDVEMINPTIASVSTCIDEGVWLSRLPNLTYLAVGFIELNNNVVLENVLPCKKFPMPNIASFRAQCRSSEIGGSSFCHEGLMNYNVTKIRHLFPNLRVLSLAGAYPVEDVILEFPWGENTTSAAPLNYRDSSFYLLHSTTENYRAKNSTHEASRILSIVGQYGVNTSRICPFHKTLHMFVLYDCNATYIPSDCFNPNATKNSTLHYIDLAKNNFSEIDVNLFRGLESLEILHLSNCKIKSLAAGLFEDLKNLQVLDLNFNQIRELNASIFTNLVSLKSLFLHNNEIARIDQGSLPTNSHNLTFVDLKQNNLTQVPVDCLTLPYLHLCSCDHNQITLKDSDFEKLVMYFNPVEMLFLQASSYYGGTFNHADVGIMHESDQSEISLRDNPTELIQFNKSWSE